MQEVSAKNTINFFPQSFEKSCHKHWLYFILWNHFGTTIFTATQQTGKHLDNLKKFWPDAVQNNKFGLPKRNVFEKWCTWAKLVGFPHQKILEVPPKGWRATWSWDFNCIESLSEHCGRLRGILLWGLSQQQCPVLRSDSCWRAAPGHTPASPQWLENHERSVVIAGVWTMTPGFQSRQLQLEGQPFQVLEPNWGAILFVQQAHTWAKSLWIRY